MKITIPNIRKRPPTDTEPPLDNAGPTAPKRKRTRESSSRDSLFNRYKSNNEDMIGPDGIMALCSDLGLDFTDHRMLMFVWKLQAKTRGYISWEEWRRGLTYFGVHSLSSLKRSIEELDTSEIVMESQLQDFYRYAFWYSLTDEGQKFLDIETICQLLKSVLRPYFWNQVDMFRVYLRLQTDYKVISMDQWMGFIRFCRQINFPSLSNYDPMEAWPLIIDNFVEWFKERNLHVSNN